MSDEKRPAWRNPYVWGFIVGAILLTLVAPRFRKIAPPPEITGKLPEWALVDQEGRPFGSRELLGRVALVALVSESEPEASRAVATAFATVAPRIAVARAEVAFVLVDLDGREAASRAAWLASAAPGVPVRMVTGEGEAACDLAVAGFAPGRPTGPACAAAASLVRDARLLLVDAAGNARGLYGSSGKALYETFERALRTCDEVAR